MARISTHVLDTARGAPAAGVRVRLYACEGNSRHPMKSAVTNADGRTDEPLLEGERLRQGWYELEFSVAGYFGETGESPPFLGEVVVRFGVSDPLANYHVPLLVAPHGYTTYRGS
ncbi:MAG: hydroxyisourate hydrolase [Acidobacteriia bacterium]|nr:hydroxyisourate hydrolase [Terriglobia bacterium]